MKTKNKEQNTLKKELKGFSLLKGRRLAYPGNEYEMDDCFKL